MATRCGCSWSTRSGCSDSRPVPKGPVVKAPGLLFVSTSAQVAAEQARGQAGNRASRIFFVSPPRANPFSSRWIASPVKRNQKTCPCIRTWRPRPATSGPLTPSSLLAPLALRASLRLLLRFAAFHDDSTRPPERAVSLPHLFGLERVPRTPCSLFRSRRTTRVTKQLLGLDNQPSYKSPADTPSNGSHKHPALPIR